MFKSTDCDIPQNKVDYIIEVLKNNRVTVSVRNIVNNSHLDMVLQQQYEHAYVDMLNVNNDTNISPRLLTVDMYRHKVLELISRNGVYRIYFSVPINVYNAHELISNKRIEWDDKMSVDLGCIYWLSVRLREVVASLQYILDDDVYRWSEVCSPPTSTDLQLHPDNSYVYALFEELKNTTKMFVDVFGYDTLDDIRDIFSVCGHCGIKYLEE